MTRRGLFQLVGAAIVAPRLPPVRDTYMDELMVRLTPPPWPGPRADRPTLSLDELSPYVDRLVRDARQPVSGTSETVGYPDHTTPPRALTVPV